MTYPLHPSIDPAFGPRLLELADVIEFRKPIIGEILGFNMSWWHENVADDARDHDGIGCRTVACIGGTAAALFFPDKELIDIAEYEVGIALGLNRYDHRINELFFMYGPIGSSKANDISYSSVSRSNAANVLRRLAYTGKVDWRRKDEAFSPDELNEFEPA